MILPKLLYSNIHSLTKAVESNPRCGIIYSVILAKGSIVTSIQTLGPFLFFCTLKYPSLGLP
jgi:hypothetical protein